MPEAPTDPAFLTGKMLVAMPGIDDPRFERAVLYVCAHTGEQAMGLTLNRPVDGLTVKELLGRLGVDGDIRAPDDLVLMGGPVERERGFVLHTDDYVSAGSSVQVGPGVTLTASRDVLQALAGDTAPRRALMALGYAGWGPGQLERELRDNVWLICEADEDLIFDGDHAGKWSGALARLGVSAAMLSAAAGSA